uniref:Tripartite motif-containing protein 59 n=1 Tax=Gopherus agassizii TaxID=38772 RepID=A0A452GGK5_9SAUR
MHHFEEELTCSICYSIFEDPRVLPCSHTFCRNCLESVLQLSSNFSIWRPLRLPLKCPNCRSIVEIPPSGTESLPINFALKAIIEKYQQQDHPDVATCSEHYRQPLNVYCLLDRKLVCGHCLTIGKHHGHPIDDLQSAYMKEKETPRKLLEQLTDEHWTNVCLLIEKLEEQKSHYENIVQDDKKAVVQYFKKLNDTLEHKKQALLAALDEVNAHISEEYAPLVENMKRIREEQLDLMSLNTSVQEEESPLLFLEKVDVVQSSLCLNYCTRLFFFFTFYVNAIEIIDRLQKNLNWFSRLISTRIITPDSPHLLKYVKDETEECVGQGSLLIPLFFPYLFPSFAPTPMPISESLLFTDYHSTQ